MSNPEFWQKKLNALLHDPPDKPLDIKGHQGQAQTWARLLNLTFSKPDFQEADWIASAADRLNFPSYRSIGGADFQNRPYLSHPLAGVRLNLSTGRFLPSQINADELQKAIQQSLESIPDAIKQDPKKLFLWLWRNWSDQIQKTQGNLGVLWDLLPADTQIPDHSIWAHQALTSAIATALPQPAFLLFTIGPVQAFISAARRTQDLWAGSYLLSYLNWAAIEVIAEEIGPDAVIFPSLLGQPLCDRWLYHQDILPQRPQAENLILPSLPNRFLAIVPYKQGIELAKEAANRVQSQWKEISQAVRKDLEGILKHSPAWSQTWEEQTKYLFETYWQVYPWRPNGNEPIQAKDFEQFLGSHRPYLGDRADDIAKILQVYAKSDQQGGGQYKPNIGAIYSNLYYLTEKALGSRKGLRNFPQVEERGDKSTLGGDRAALYDGIDHENLSEGDFDRGRRRDIRKFWDNLATKLQEARPRRFELQEGGQERLDAVELTKRCAWRSYFQQHLNIPPETGDANEDTRYQLRFPSTGSVATASFKAQILTRILEDSEAQSLRQDLDNWVVAVRKSPLISKNQIRWDVIPYLAVKVHQSDELLKQFLGGDGRLLFPETYQPEQYSLSKLDQKQLEIALNALNKFIKTAQKFGIAKPKKYFAVLMMDGDTMGQWIAGDKMPSYQDVLHPETRKKLETRQDWQPILQTKRLMSPAIHGFISKALGDFSLTLVRHIVESRYPGKLVYAGGDDVLALLPIDCTLQVARELRAAFSGEIYTGDNGEEFEVKFGDCLTRSGYLLLKQPGKERRLYATMGHKATASTGIAIANYKQPLDLTLEAVRNAEKSAKSKEGRDAFSLTFLKRSGETVTAGAKWTYNEKSIDTVQVLLEFQQKFAQDEISGKFAYILKEESETLADFDDADFIHTHLGNLYTSEIKRLLKRQQGNKVMSKQEREELLKQFEDMAEQLSKLVMQAELEKPESSQSSDKLKTFADLLIFTRFLATGEGED
jgi:CRISPR-associated protein Cmr2